MPRPKVTKYELLPHFTFLFIFGFKVGYKDERIFVHKGPVGPKGHKYGGWFNLGLTVAGHKLQEANFARVVVIRREFDLVAFGYK